MHGLTLRCIVVLIETLWNVKLAVGVFVAPDTGINRNIVECKE